MGGTQGPSLGTPIAIYDSLLSDGPGKEVPDGTPGELVATAAFPNVPVFLWGDKTPAGIPGSKYHSSYFARFDHVVSNYITCLTLLPCTSRRRTSSFHSDCQTEGFCI